MFLIHQNPKGKPTSESAIESEKIQFFDDSVSLNEVIFGSRILNLVNGIALKSATMHAGVSCQPVGIDFIRYFSQIKRGDILICKAQVNHVWENIIEVGVKVLADDFLSLEQKKILSAYFIFKADSDEVIPQVIPEKLIDKKRFADAEKRRKIREKRKTN
ncbi:MAG: hotdog domain-containing protein [Parachlamydiales bacterium]